MCSGSGGGGGGASGPAPGEPGANAPSPGSPNSQAGQEAANASAFGGFGAEQGPNSPGNTVDRALDNLGLLDRGSSTSPGSGDGADILPPPDPVALDEEEPERATRLTGARRGGNARNQRRDSNRSNVAANRRGKAGLSV